MNQTNSRIGAKRTEDCSRLEAKITELQKQKAETIELLKQLSKEVGMYWGEKIEKHLASINGSRHVANDWNVTDINGEQ